MGTINEYLKPCAEVINKSNQCTKYLSGVIDHLAGQPISHEFIADFYKDAGVLYGSASQSGNAQGLLGFTATYTLKMGYVNVKLQDAIDNILNTEE